MSRITKHNQDYLLAFGQDPICGLFMQVFRQGQDDEPVLDLNNLTRDQLNNLADDYGFDLRQIEL